MYCPPKTSFAQLVRLEMNQLKIYLNEHVTNIFDLMEITPHCVQICGNSEFCMQCAESIIADYDLVLHRFTQKMN